MTVTPFIHIVVERPDFQIFQFHDVDGKYLNLPTLLPMVSYMVVSLFDEVPGAVEAYGKLKKAGLILKETTDLETVMALVDNLNEEARVEFKKGIENARKTHNPINP